MILKISGFPSSVGADDGVNLAFIHFKADVLTGCDPPKSIVIFSTLRKMSLYALRLEVRLLTLESGFAVQWVHFNIHS